MNWGRTLWWAGLVALTLACAVAVALAFWIHNGEGATVLKYAETTRAAKTDGLQKTDAEKAADFERRALLKSWMIDHSLVGTGIVLVVISFSGLALFLLITCLVERKRWLRGPLPKITKAVDAQVMERVSKKR